MREDQLIDDHLREECGVFGVFGHEDAARIIYHGLFALQHRGQESAGITTFDGQIFHNHKDLGEVNDVFAGNVLKSLPGPSGIGHVRYSTTGSSTTKNVQPIQVDSWRGTIAIAHNGNLFNIDGIRNELSRQGSIFNTSSDTELILHLLVRSPQEEFLPALVDALTHVEGTFSLVVLIQNQLVAVRDPYGVRPLSLGKLDGAWVIASETCAFDLIGAEFVRDIEPGEVVVINHQGLTSIRPFKKVPIRPCAFEHVYFSRPDSVVFGSSVQQMRKNFGRQLAIEHPAGADVVIPVPDSGNFAALGFSEQSGTPFDMGIIRNHYIGRTFIQPNQESRSKAARIKLNPVRNIIEGKRVVVVDDSIVRGTTSKKLIAIIRQAKPKEIHFRISSPPIRWSCYYGIDTPTRDELIANTKSVEEIRAFLEVDTLGYLSLDGLLSRLHANSTMEHYCTACWSGQYDVSFPRVESPEQLRISFQHT